MKNNPKIVTFKISKSPLIYIYIYIKLFLIWLDINIKERKM